MKNRAILAGALRNPAVWNVGHKYGILRLAHQIPASALHHSMSLSGLQIRAEPAALQRAPMVAKDWAVLVGPANELSEEVTKQVSVLKLLLKGGS